MADNLLDKASILLTPTAYDNGRMLSVKPNKNLYGSELVTNGDFATDSDWTKGTGWTIANGKANCDGTQTGNTNLNNSSDNGIVNNKFYKIVYTISNYVSGSIRIKAGNTGFGIYHSSNGTYTQYIKAQVTTFPYAQFNADADFIGSIDNVSVVEDLSGDFQFSRSSAATRVNAQGLVENVQIISSELVSNGNFSQIGTEEVLNGNFSQEGSELVTNGDFATDSDWILTQATISNGSASFATTDGSFAGIRQNVFTVGKTYLISLEVSNLIGTAEVDTNGGASIGLDITTNGTKSFYMKADSTDIEIKRKFGAEQVISATIDNVSVKEVGQNWTLGTGWSIGEDKAISDGTINQSLLQPNLFTIGKSYKINFTISDVVGSLDARIWMATGGAKIEVNANGNYTTYWQADGTNLYTTTLSTNTATYSITNISVKEVGQDWNLGGWTIGDGKVFNDGVNTGNINQSNLLNLNSKYRVSVSIKDYNSGKLNVRLGTGAQIFVADSLGDFELELESTTSNDALRFYPDPSDPFNGSITNISIKEITDDTDLPRINYEGFSYQDTLGSELVTNGDFSVDSNWAKNNGATISGGKGNIIGDGSSFTNLTQSNVFTIGKNYKVTVDVTINSGLGLKFQDGATDSNFGTATTSGSYTFYGVANNSSFVIGRKTGGTAFDSSIDNVSVKEYLGQEVVPDSGCGNWLLEPQSTNLVTYSEDFSGYIKSGINIVSNIATSPDGTVNATSLTNTTTGQSHIRTSFVAASTGNYTGTSYIKKQDFDFIYVELGNAFCWFNISNGTLGNSGNFGSGWTFISHSIESVGNDWYRFSITANNTITGTYNFRPYQPTSANASYTSGLLGSSFIWGTQVEQQSYATSYIPTNGATNTRLQDIATNSGNSTLINSTEGVLYAEIAALANDGTIRYLSLSDGTSNNRVTILYYSSSNNIRMIVSSNGTNYADKNYGVSSVLDFHKIAIKYKENDFALWVDGIEAKTDNSGNAPIGLDNLSFSIEGGDNFYGKTKAVAVYKEALTDAQLQSLTTI